MKYLKLFEEIEKDELQIGYYVICKEHSKNNNDIKMENFESNNIGQYVNFDINTNFNYIIQYENVPEEISHFFRHGGELVNCRSMERSEIKYWSENKKDLEHYIIVNKYNI